MTITYQSDVATSSFCGFAKLLSKWRGSAYKLVYKEMLVFILGYYLISLSYRFSMDQDQKRLFERIALHCARYLDLIPLSFLLGFYVTFVVQRWWSQFTAIPWPDRTMNTVMMYVHGTDERGRMIRRTLMRYLNLSFVLILTSISVSVKKRFPTIDHLVEAGFMTSEERMMFNRVQAKINKYWIPMCWFINLLELARKEGRIRDGAPIKHILEELNEFRSKTSLLWCFDWVTVPLVYTQVVTWATHLFFTGCLLGRQFLDPAQKYPDHDIDMYVPIFTFLQFFFYMGWLKVAEQLINPFGEDDDDFETNWLIDRHIQVSYLGVDELYGKLPTMEKDMYWDDNVTNVPYTPAALIHKIPAYKGSTMHLKVQDHYEPMVQNEFQASLLGYNRRKSSAGNILAHARRLGGSVIGNGVLPTSQPIPNNSSFVIKVDNGHATQTPMGTHDNDPSGDKKINGLKAVVVEHAPAITNLWRKLLPLNKTNSDTHSTGSGSNGDDFPLKTRTLGRKESLMADDFLAMLNKGGRKHSSAALYKFNGVPANQCIVEVETPVDEFRDEFADSPPLSFFVPDRFRKTSTASQPLSDYFMSVGSNYSFQGAPDALSNGGQPIMKSASGSSLKDEMHRLLSVGSQLGNGYSLLNPNDSMLSCDGDSNSSTLKPASSRDSIHTKLALSRLSEADSEEGSPIASPKTKFPPVRESSSNLMKSAENINIDDDDVI